MRRYLRHDALPYRTGNAFSATASYLQSTALLLARLGFGFSLFLTGRGHLRNVEKMIERFTEWNVPYPKLSVYVSGWTELVCGLLLMVGLFTRPAALVLVFNFVVAYLTASSEKVKAVRDSLLSSEKWGEVLDDAAFPFLMISLIFLAFGAGKASLDYLLRRVVFTRDLRLGSVAVPGSAGVQSFNVEHPADTVVTRVDVVETPPPPRVL